MPSRERFLFVCTNRRADDHAKGSCAARGSEELLKELKGELLQAFRAALRGVRARLRACACALARVCVRACMGVPG